MEQAVNELYKQYGERFMREWQQEDRYIPSIIPTDDNVFIEDQLSFMSEYLGFMTIDGVTSENLARIKRFISLQGATEGSELTIQFMWGKPYYEVFVCVEGLDDIDLVDVQSMTEFKEMHVSRVKTWTKAQADAFMEEVRKDFAFDGMRPALSYRANDGLLVITCHID